MKKLINYLLSSFMLLMPFINLAQTTRQVEYSNSITVEELKDHMFYLASDELEGRLPGSKHFDIAADYAITQFKQAGLKPICIDSSGNKSFKQLIHIDKYEVSLNDSLIFERNGEKKVLSFPKDYTYENLANTARETLTGDAVFVGYGINEPGLNWNDFKGIDLKDKWIVMFYDLNGEYNEDLKLKINDSGKSVEDIIKKRNDIICSSEAKGVIYILRREWLDSWDNFAYNFGKKMYSTGIGVDSGIQWISAGVEFLNRIFQDEDFDPVNLKGEYKSYAFKDLNITLNKDFMYSKIISHNVLAFVEGSDPDLKEEFIVLGAHLDHLGIINGVVMNGADDNASGSASVIEIAEAVALSNPKRSVAFILFTGEEFGFVGSKYFVDHSPVDLNSIQLYVNFDMIGRLDGPASDVAPIGYNKGPVWMKDILNNVNGESVNLNLDYAYADDPDYLDDSDQYWFYKNEIPIVFLTSGIHHNDFHKPTDDAEKIDFELMRNVSVLTYNLIMEVANKEESFRNK